MELIPQTGAGYDHHWLPFPSFVLKDALANKKLNAMGYLLTFCVPTSQFSPNKKANTDSSVCLWSKPSLAGVRVRLGLCKSTDLFTAQRTHPTNL